MTFSVLVSLLLSKLLGMESFAYWQLFILYSGYVGFFHFGLSDGLYLRYGGSSLEEMDKPLIGSQLRLMASWQIALCCLLLLGIPFFRSGEERRFIWSMLAIYLVLANVTWGFGFIFQAANETRIYSISIMISKGLFIIYFVYTILTNSYNYKHYILAFILTQGIAASYCLYKGRKFLIARWIPMRRLFIACIENIRIGISLTVSNVASSLVLGIGKIFVDRHWDLNAFGILALSVSLISFVLQFISQVSMVMFPTLRNMSDDSQHVVYAELDSTLGILLCGVLVFYSPFRFVLAQWLPNYAYSLTYLAIMLPICVLDGKMNLLYGTYMKVLRKERVLLLVNLSACVLGIVLCFLLTAISDSVIMVVYAMLIAIVLRNLAVGIYLSHLMHSSHIFPTIVELILCTLFIILQQAFSSIIAFSLFTILYAGCMVAFRQKVLTSIRLLGRHLK